MNNKVYLSIDLDFFNNQNSRSAYYQLDHLVNQLITKCNVKPIAVMNHQQLLKHVNQCSARTLINLDEHSDLGGPMTTKLNCGTWVDYVRWRTEGTYIWIRNRHSFYGDCSADDINWSKPVHPSWESLKTRYKYGLSTQFINKLVDNVIAAGLVLSPMYSHSNLEKPFREIVKKYRLRYLKGTRSEDFAYDILPYEMDRKYAGSNLYLKYNIDERTSSTPSRFC